MQALAQGDDTMVDVEYVELSEEKEKLALLILDKTSELATVDNASLEALVGDVQTAEQDLADLITEMSQEAGLVPADDSTPGAILPLQDKAAPDMAWIVVGLPLSRFGETAELVDRFKDDPDVIMETTVEASRQD
jgi:hypothetical protein